MTPLDQAFHLLNFIAPAFVLALVMPLASRFILKIMSVTLSIPMQIAIQFVAGCAVVFAGLWFFGRDGKMLTYAALVGVMASCQWLLSKSWRA